MNKLIKAAIFFIAYGMSQVSYGALVTVNFSGFVDYMSDSQTSITGTTFTTSDTISGSFTYETDGTYLSSDYFSVWENNWFETFFSFEATVSGVNGVTTVGMEDASTRTLIQRNLSSTQETNLRFRPYISSQDNSVDLGNWTLDFGELWFKANPLDHLGTTPVSIPDADTVTNLATPLQFNLTNNTSGEREFVYLRLSNYDSFSIADSSQPIPEPKPLALIGMGILAMVMSRRRA